LFKDEELDFIIHYDAKYRIGKKLENGQVRVGESGEKKVGHETDEKHH